MAANIRCIMRAKAPYGQGITKMKVKLTPEQSSTPSLLPETNSVYLSRPTEGTGELMELVGGSVAWNQLVDKTAWPSSSGLFTNNGDGSITANGTASGNQSFGYDVTFFQTNHIYLADSGNSSQGSSTTFEMMVVNFSAQGANLNVYTNTVIKKMTNTITNTQRIQVVVRNGYTANDLTWRPQIVDLTQMFGSTIADYVYSLEQSTAGSGIAWLQSYGFFTEGYIPYSAATLQSVEASAHVTKDANNTIIATYPLDSDLVLRGIPKLNNGSLYYDGDTYEWDGTVTRKCAEVDLGTLTWVRLSWGYRSASLKGTIKTPSSNVSAANIRSDRYTTQAYESSDSNGISVSVDGYLAVIASDSPTGQLVYELATPTTESADPYTAVQTVEDGGTEEFTTSNGVPVGVVGRFANAVPMEGVDSFTVTADDGTTHTYPVTLSEEIYRGYVDMLTGEAISEAASIAEYNGETISEPWLSSLDVYSAGATPTNGAQVVYPITPEEVTATITGDPSTLSGVVSATSTEGTVDWSELSEIGIKCIMKRKNPFQ